MVKTISELHDNFCQDAALGRNLRPATIRWYKNSIRPFLKFYDGRVELPAHITTEALKIYLYTQRKQRDWSPDHSLNQYKALKSFLKWCVENKHLQTNPILSIPKPRLEKKLPKRISIESARSLLTGSFMPSLYRYKFTRYRNRALIATLLFAGLRASELTNLKIKHIDWSNGANGCLYVFDGKGGKDRILPVSSKLKTYLLEYIKEGRGQALPDEYLFVTRAGKKKIAYSNLRVILKTLHQKTGIPFTAHKLRHTFATLMLEGGCNLFSLQKMLGHSDIQTTTIYLSASVDELTKQIAKHPLDMV